MLIWKGDVPEGEVTNWDLTHNNDMFISYEHQLNVESNNKLQLCILLVSKCSLHEILHGEGNEENSKKEISPFLRMRPKL